MGRFICKWMMERVLTLLQSSSDNAHWSTTVIRNHYKKQGSFDRIDNLKWNFHCLHTHVFVLNWNYLGHTKFLYGFEEIFNGFPTLQIERSYKKLFVMQSIPWFCDNKQHKQMNIKNRNFRFKKIRNIFWRYEEQEGILCHWYKQI